MWVQRTDTQAIRPFLHVCSARAWFRTVACIYAYLEEVKLCIPQFDRVPDIAHARTRDRDV